MARYLSLLLLLFFVGFSHAGKNTRVVIDPGHGGKDKGAIWGGVRESDLNMKVARKLYKMLKNRGVSVSMTRQSDVYVSLEKRAAVANRYKDVIFVSIHFNASRVTSIRGLETFYASPAGKRIANNIQTSILKRVKVKNRKIKRGMQYAVLNKTKCPAVLVECGFISNSHERRRCNSAWYQTLVARGIVDGIIKSR